MRTKREPANAAHVRCWCNGKASIQPSLFLPKSGEAWRPLAESGWGGLNARLTGATSISKLAWEAGASQLTLTQAAPAPEKGREGEERH